jgi:hypothetical protein
MYFAPLNELSILKSLHSVLASSSVTPEELAGGNIDGALREWFFHGREVFDKRLKQMQEIVKKAGIAHHCSDIDVSYDQRLAEWKNKYLGEGLPPVSFESPTTL